MRKGRKGARRTCEEFYPWRMRCQTHPPRSPPDAHSYAPGRSRPRLRASWDALPARCTHRPAAVLPQGEPCGTRDLAGAAPAPARRVRLPQARRSAGGTGTGRGVRALGAVGGRRRGRRYPLMPCVLRPPSSVPRALSVSQPVPDRGRDGERVPPHFPTGCGRHPCVHAWP